MTYSLNLIAKAAGERDEKVHQYIEKLIANKFGDTKITVPRGSGTVIFHCPSKQIARNLMAFISDYVDTINCERIIFKYSDRSKVRSVECNMLDLQRAIAISNRQII